MHLSMSSPRGGGGGGSGIGWGFWHFLKKNVKIPTPGEKELSKLAEKNGFLLFYSLELKDKMHNVRSKSPPWGYTPQSKSRGLPDPPPPPLGLDIDRCIINLNKMAIPKKAYLLSFLISRHYHKIMKLKCKARRYLSLSSCNCVS